MRKWCTLVFALFTASLSIAQDVDLTGTWQVRAITRLSSYSFQEYRGTQGEKTPDQMILGSDGTASVTISGLAVESWQMDEGFLMLMTASGNLFYYPRLIDDGIYFLVRVDVLEKNEEVISITTVATGNLMIVSQ